MSRVHYIDCVSELKLCLSIENWIANCIVNVKLMDVLIMFVDR